ncbi:MAG TPA: hypothetical protein VL961_06095 [Acidimicrobiales bacterium]|nr:hypothetical protein [Acidimicrobiales bacterium]
MLPTALVMRLFRRHWNYTVVLDGRPAGKLGNQEVKVLAVEPGEHRFHLRFVQLRRSGEMRVDLAEGEERTFVSGTSGLGWPTLREATTEDVAEGQRTPTSEP